jgi:hypothetical protein
MESVGLSVQQGSAQLKAGITAVKQAAKSDQAIVNVISDAVQSSASNGRGQILDITV